MSKITETTLHEILASKSLDYTVDTINIQDPFTNQPSKFFGTYRTDTKEIFTMNLSKHFTPIQNIDAFKFLTELSENTNFEIANGGSFNNGASVYLQLALGKSDIGGGDYVGNYLTFVNSHDGSRSMNVILTPYRFFCKNQIAPAFRQIRKNESAGEDVRIIMRHTAGATIAMERLIDTVSIANNQFEYSVETYKKLAQTKVDEHIVANAIAKMFSKPDDNKPRAKTIYEENIAHVRARFISADNGQCDQWTGWNLYNAIQGTLQHDARESSNRVKSILIGNIAKRSEIALDIVSELVGI